jgi:hypothetical protein
MKRFLSIAIVSIPLAAGAATSLAQSRPAELPQTPPPPAVVEGRPESVDRPGPIARERMRAAREKEAARTGEARPERRRERGAEAGPGGPPTPPTPSRPQRREMIERRVERMDADGPARQRGGESQNDDRRRDLERRIEQLRGEIAEMRKDRAEGDRRAPRADREDRARRFDDGGGAPGKQRHKARGKQMRGEGVRGGHGAQGGPSREQLMRFWRRYHTQQHFQGAPARSPRGFAGRAQQGPAFRAPSAMGQFGGFARPDFQHQGPTRGGQQFGGAGGPRGPQMNEGGTPLPLSRPRRSHRDAN